LAEALVHESIHNLLSTYEYLHMPFVLSRDKKQYRPVSPWSGNPIPVASFCHAVFVWFALYNMSLRELDQVGIGNEQMLAILQRRNQYASGFVAPTRMSDYLRSLAQYSEGFLGVLDKLQDIARGLTMSGTAEAYEETAVAV
jgi:hypothetical protein